MKPIFSFVYFQLTVITCDFYDVSSTKELLNIICEHFICEMSASVENRFNSFFAYYNEQKFYLPKRGPESLLSLNISQWYLKNR